MNDKLIVTLYVEELRNIVDECIMKALNQIHPIPDEDILLKRIEVARMFKVSLVTLNQWRREGIITPYKIKSRVFFKRSDIMNAINNSVKKYGRKGECRHSTL